MNYNGINIPLLIIGGLITFSILNFLDFNLGFGLFGLIITGGTSLLGGYFIQKALYDFWIKYKTSIATNKKWLIPDIVVFLIFIIIFSSFSLDSFMRGGFMVFMGTILLVTIYARLRLPKINKDGKSAESDGRLARIKSELGGSELATQNDLSSVTDPYGFYTAAPYHHWFKEGHIITVGGSGSGKGACMLIPNLISPKFLQTQTSVFCFDPKGENYAVSKDAMERAGYQVFLLNPMNILRLGSSNLNVFDLVKKDSPDAFTFCRTVAEALSPEGGKDDTADHFAGQAKSLLVAYMLYMLETKPQDSSFATLYDMLVLPLAEREVMLAKMSLNKAFDGAISRQANQIINGISGGGIREISGIYSNATKALSAFQDYSLRAISKKSDFSIYSLLERPTAIFLSVKLSDIDGYAGWIRTLVRLLTREIEDRGSMKRRTLFILDEFPQLGYMKDIVKGFETLRGFGATFHIVLQDLERLKGVYPKEYKSFLSNSSVKHIMGLDDLDMAKVFSEISGTTHNVIDVGDGERINPHIKEKPVIPADELMRNWDTHYLLIKGMPNFIKMPKVKYFQNPNFQGQYGQNPYYQ